MALHTISEAVTLTRKSRKTLYTKMNSGELSYTTNADKRRVIDTSELVNGRRMTKISRAEVVELSIPFSDPGKGEGLFPSAWNALDYVLLELETDDGLTGWGDGFGYFCRRSVAAIMAESVAPRARVDRMSPPAL